MEKWNTPKKPRIGIYTMGLKAYWNQFPGLRERLLHYGQFIAEKIAEMDAEVFFLRACRLRRGRGKLRGIFKCQKCGSDFCPCGHLCQQLLRPPHSSNMQGARDYTESAAHGPDRV